MPFNEQPLHFGLSSSGAGNVVDVDAVDALPIQVRVVRSSSSVNGISTRVREPRK
jgi:hypothetical protein